MTYCVAMCLADGLVFASDSRTNAGFDQISTFRKMHVFRQPGERELVVLSAGNLSVGMPVDVAIYRNGSLKRCFTDRVDDQSPYFQSLRTQWHDGIQTLIHSLEPPIIG